MTMSPSLADRAAGVSVGALIGDALGLGPHGYYDLEALHRDFGPWIYGYVEPRPGGYHAGLKAGDLAQSGLICLELLRPQVDHGGLVAGVGGRPWPSSWCGRKA